MHRLFLALLSMGVALPWGAEAQQAGESLERVSEELIALERSALDRWITADPDGYLGLYARETTYFDPNQERRIDGLQALTAQFAPLKGMQLPFTEPRYEMLAPKVQLFADTAVLTFNLVNYGKVGGQAESVLTRWNSTEVYHRIDGQWRLVHSHWSYVKPAVQPPL